jgi:hypothetical protein
MQVTAAIGIGRPAPGSGRKGFCSLSKGIRLSAAVAGLTLAAVLEPVHGQGVVLEGLRQTVVSRWEFQERFPLAAKAFADQLTAPEASALEAQLRAEPSSGRTAAAAPVLESKGIFLPDLWRTLALGLCAESRRPGGGEDLLLDAVRMTHGSIPAAFEVARLLQGSGMFLRASAAQREVRRAMLAQGYARVPELAKMELRRARQAVSEGSFQTARHSQEFAARLDPHAPWAPLLSLEIHLRETPPWQWDLGFAWARVVEASQLARHYDVLSVLLLNLSRILRYGFAVFGGLCVIGIGARHFARAAHPIAERLPHVVEMRVRYLAIALVPASFAVGGAGYAALALGAVCLLWRHASVVERAILKAVLTGLALLPMVLMGERSLGRHLDPASGLHLYHMAYARGPEPALAAKVSAHRPAGAEDDRYRSLAASLLFKKQGNLIRAEEEAAQVLRNRPGDALALVHAGNISLLGFQHAKAAGLYSRAREAEPGRVEAWFNASQAELYASNSDRHKRFLDRAAELDPQRVTGFLKENDELFPSVPPNRKAMDPMPPAGQGWRAAWAGALDMDFLRIRVRSGIADLPGFWLILGVIAVSLGLFARFRNHSRNVHGRDLFDCKICGRVMCRTCRKGVHCQACFKAVAGIQDGRVRAELAASLRKRSSAAVERWGRILDAVVPGFGRIYLGDGRGRFAWLLAFSLALGLFLAMRDPVMEYPAADLGLLGRAALPPLLLVYAFHHARFLRRQRPFPSAAAVAAGREKEAVA